MIDRTSVEYAIVIEVFILELFFSKQRYVKNTTRNIISPWKILLTAVFIFKMPSLIFLGGSFMISADGFIL